MDVKDETQLQELIKEAYSNSKDHGFHDGEEAMNPEYVQMSKIALMHSELSEALECVRDGDPVVDGTRTTYCDETGKLYTHLEVTALKFDIRESVGPIKPLGLLSEYADVLIRIFDEVGRLDRGSEFEQVLYAKMRFNRSRPHKHGRKC